MLDCKITNIQYSSTSDLNTQQTGKHHRNHRMPFQLFPCARWNAILIVYSVLMREISCSSTTCAQGYEYQCQWVTNSTGCINGCNVTIAQILAPGSCVGSCCKMCFLDCFLCVYVKVFVIQITNKPWSSKFRDKKSDRFIALEEDLNKAITSHLSRHNIKKFGLALLEVEESPPNIDVFIMLTSSNKWNEDKALQLLHKAAKSGHLGEIKTGTNLFKVMEESEYRYRMEQTKKYRLDIIEAVVTCVAAGVIVSAVAGILYLFCTTPNQRCMSCKRRNRVN